MHEDGPIEAIGWQDLFTFAQELMAQAKSEHRSLTGSFNGAHQSTDGLKDFIFTVTPDTTLAEIEAELTKYLSKVETEYAWIVMSKFRWRVKELVQ